jgi:hypothetical protein
VGSLPSRQAPVANSCKHGDEPSGSGATELVSVSAIAFARNWYAKYLTQAPFSSSEHENTVHVS